MNSNKVPKGNFCNRCRMDASRGLGVLTADFDRVVAGVGTAVVFESFRPPVVGDAGGDGAGGDVTISGSVTADGAGAGEEDVSGDPLLGADSLPLMAGARA